MRSNAVMPRSSWHDSTTYWRVSYEGWRWCSLLDSHDPMLGPVWNLSGLRDLSLQRAKTPTLLNFACLFGFQKISGTTVGSLLSASGYIRTRRVFFFGDLAIPRPFQIHEGLDRRIYFWKASGRACENLWGSVATGKTTDSQERPSLSLSY